MGEHTVLAIDHVGIAVADLDAAIDWYGSMFGLVATHTETNAEQGVREAMLAAPGDVAAAVQLLAPSRRTPRSASSSTATAPASSRWPTDGDIDASCAALRGEGARLLYDEPRRGTAGSRINFVHPKDAAGVLFELVEPAPDPAH